MPAQLDPQSAAGRYGSELLRRGFTIDQVVHTYGDICQAVTELAVETKAAITIEEFRTFNSLLDDAIADAVTEFAHQRDQAIASQEARTTNERLGSLAHELRNLLNSAMLAFDAIESGNVALNGATGALLGRSLARLRDLIDRSLADVRLTEGLPERRERIAVNDLIEDVRVSAAMDAKNRGIGFTTQGVEASVVVEADRQTLAAAVANLLQNALKFTRPNTEVSLVAHAHDGCVLIEVADACGGLPQGSEDDLFQAFSQRGNDRTGLGLGLSISRRGVEANGGKVSVRNIPGTGCVFTVDLPQR
ncbi:MAG: sensor histidine kinase [Myxococcota bacterium]